VETHVSSDGYYRCVPVLHHKHENIHAIYITCHCVVRQKRF